MLLKRKFFSIQKQMTGNIVKCQFRPSFDKLAQLFFYVCHSHLEHIMYSRFNHDNLLWNSRATVFDGLLRVCSSKNYNGVKLSVIQLVHSIGCHIQKGVLAFVHDVSDGRQSDNTWLASLTGRVQLCKMETVMASNRINNWPGLRIVTTFLIIFSKC